MNNSKTPKIVVAAGLAAIYATGTVMVMRSNAADGSFTQNAAVEAAAQLATEPVPPFAVDSESTGASTGVAGQPAAMTEAPAPVIKANIVEKQGISVVATASPANRSDIGMPNPTGAVASVGNEPGISTGDAPLSGEVVGAYSGSDIPAGSVDVLTEDGSGDRGIEPAQ